MLANLQKLLLVIISKISKGLMYNQENSFFAEDHVLSICKSRFRPNYSKLFVPVFTNKEIFKKIFCKTNISYLLKHVHVRIRG